MHGSPQAAIRTPDQRLRVFVSSTLQELADERVAAAQAVRHLRLAPVLFEMGARPHPPRDLYRAYLEQSDVFVGIYWQRYGWVAPGEDISGLEDEYRLASRKPKLIYVKTPADEREPRLKQLLGRIRDDEHVSYKMFATPAQLRSLLENDLALLLSERFVQVQVQAQVQAEVEAPPERPVAAMLPSPTSSFVGRQKESAELRRLLGRRDVRLVTLSGPGGVGKTRLSLEVGRQLESAFADGVFFISLAATSDPSLVLASIEQQLGVRQQGGRKPMQRLVDHLREKRALLILDNFEQIVAAAPDVAALLAACPGLTLLVTSRTSLRISGERELLVQPLDLPSDLHAAQHAPAVRLFLERAQAMVPDFGRTPAEMAAVVAVCRRLDGLPLAIELAASRAKMLSAQAILARLDDVLRLLSNGARDLPARQRTLRGTLDWSYDLLDQAERNLFARLSVFPGGWTLEGAEAVCQCPGVDVLDTLMSLVENSLIQVSSRGAQRFTMLATIRDYAHERLAASAEAPAVARAQAEYMLHLAVEADAKLRGSDQRVWRDRLAAEHDNIAVALRWLLDQGELRMAASLQVTLAIFWWIQGYSGEARRWTDELLAREASAPEPSRAQIHLTSGLAAAWEGDYPLAAQLLERSVAEFRNLGLSQGAGVAQMALAYISAKPGDQQHMDALLLESTADLYGAGDLWAVSVALLSRAEVALAAGEVCRARELYDDGLGLANTQSDTRGRAQALIGLGFVDIATGDLAEAGERLRQSVELSTQLSNPELLAYAMRGLAGVAGANHDLARAARLLGAAQGLAEAAGSVDWPVRRRLYAGFEEETRDGLGAAAYAAAYAAGRSLSLAEAARLAEADAPEVLEQRIPATV
jgi:predicted ATPase